MRRSGARWTSPWQSKAGEWTTAPPAWSRERMGPQTDELRWVRHTPTERESQNKKESFVVEVDTVEKLYVVLAGILQGASEAKKVAESLMEVPEQERTESWRRNKHAVMRNVRRAFSDHMGYDLFMYDPGFMPRLAPGTLAIYADTRIRKIFGVAVSSFPVRNWNVTAKLLEAMGAVFRKGDEREETETFAMSYGCVEFAALDRN